MEELREIMDSKIGVIFEGKDKSGNTYMKVMAPWAQAGKMTLNKNIYPKSLLQREITRVGEKVKAGGFIGGGDHHPSGYPSVGNASHVVEKVWMDSGGKCFCEMRILPTVQGKNVMALIKGGATLGLSLMAQGTVDPKTKEVNSDLKLQSIDIVTNPAYTKGTFDKDSIFESLNFEAKKEDKPAQKQMAPLYIDGPPHQKAIDEAGGIKKEGNQMKRTPLEEEVRTRLIVYYHMAKKEGFTGTIEEWKVTDKNEILIRAACLHEAGQYPSIKAALEDLGGPEMAIKKIVEQKKVTAAECYNEAFHAGVDPTKYAEMINKSIDEKAAAVSTGWSLEERQVIFERARRAGKFTGSAEARKKLLDESPVFEDTDPDSLLEAEANKIHKGLNESGEEVGLDTIRRGLLKEREKAEKEELRLGKISFLVDETIAAGGVIRRKEEK